MKRRLNYTERKRITQDRISVELIRENGLVKCFDALINLDGMTLLDDASVYVEAYHQHELLRYPFGKAENPAPMVDTDLTELAYHENLKFRVLVVDESGENGLVLASADKIHPADKGKGDQYKKSILPVDFQDLGRQVWRVLYDSNDILLQININIPHIKSIARTDPRFFLHIYPAVVREILSHMIFIDRVDDPDDPDIDWHRNWLDFSRQITPNIEIPSYLDPRQTGFDRVEVTGWIDHVVAEFCASRGNEWRRYIGLEEGS